MINATKTLYDSGSSEAPGTISTILLNGKVAPEDCPWVKVGQLYLSVTITGEQSWLPLLARLEQDKRQFAIFSGRHGDIPNIVDRDGATLFVFAHDHLQEDECTTKDALREFSGIGIEIIDTAQGATNQKQWLIENATRHLRAGKSVIFAWCYSLFTMCEWKLEGNATQDKNNAIEFSCSDEKAAYETMQGREIATPISQIVQRDFGWAIETDTNPRRGSGEVLDAATEAATAFADEHA